MRIFGCCLLLLSFVRVYLQSLSGIKTQTFNKKNCQNGSTSILPGYTTVKCRSSLGCAFECSKRTCKSYKYDRTSSECRLSYGGLDIENDDWFCAPFNQDSLVTNDCFPPFQNFCGICIIHIKRRSPFNTYGDLQHQCTNIGGQLYRIEKYQYLRIYCLLAYSFENLLMNYAIQGRPVYDLPGMWLTDDDMIAVNPLFIFGDILAVNGLILLENGINVADVNGVICEQVT